MTKIRHDGSKTTTTAKTKDGTRPQTQRCFIVGVQSQYSKEKTIIQQTPKDFVDCISECCLNLLKGVVPLTPHQKGVLKRKKQHLRDLANRQVSVTQKKKILQTGKGLPFLPMILGPILGKAIGPAIGGVLDKIF